MAEQDDALLDRLASAQQAAEFDDALTELATDAVDLVDREALDNLAAEQHASPEERRGVRAGATADARAGLPARAARCANLARGAP